MRRALDLAGARPDQIAIARKVLLEHRDAATVVVIGRDVGRESEALTVTTLGELDTDTPEPPPQGSA